MTVKYFLIVVLLTSFSFLYSQNVNVDNERGTYWQLTNSNDSSILEILLKGTNYGKVLFKDGQILQVLINDTICGKYTNNNKDSLIISISDNQESTPFLNSGKYYKKIDYRTMYLFDNDSIWLQFYKYKIKNSHKYQNRERVLALGFVTQNIKVKVFKLAFINNFHGIERGLTIGLINKNGIPLCRCFYNGVLIGGQMGLLNFAYQNSGVQLGIYNSAFTGNDKYTTFNNIVHQNGHKGLQLGLINVVKAGDGLQIGLINIRPKNKWYAKVLPIINWNIGKPVTN